MIQPLRKDPEAFTRKMINLSFIGNGEYTSAGKAMSGKRQEKHYRKRECFVNLQGFHSLSFWILSRWLYNGLQVHHLGGSKIRQQPLKYSVSIFRTNYRAPLTVKRLQYKRQKKPPKSLFKSRERSSVSRPNRDGRTLRYFTPQTYGVHTLYVVATPAETKLKPNCRSIIMEAKDREISQSPQLSPRQVVSVYTFGQRTSYPNWVCHEWEMQYLAQSRTNFSFLED